MKLVIQTRRVISNVRLTIPLTVTTIHVTNTYFLFFFLSWIQFRSQLQSSPTCWSLCLSANLIQRPITLVLKMPFYCWYFSTQSVTFFVYMHRIILKTFSGSTYFFFLVDYVWLKFMIYNTIYFCPLFTFQESLMERFRFL